MNKGVVSGRQSEFPNMPLHCPFHLLQYKLVQQARRELGEIYDYEVTNSRSCLELHAIAGPRDDVFIKPWENWICYCYYKALLVYCYKDIKALLTQLEMCYKREKSRLG